MIYLGSDHGGFALKEKIKTWLAAWHLEYKDLGPSTLDPHDDYPAFGIAVGQAVGQQDDTKKDWGARTKGILACRSAVGVTVAANKVNGVRAVAAYDTKIAEHARTNDDANVLCLSGDWMTEDQAKEIVKIWLDTEFSKADRHTRRVQQIVAFEQTKDGSSCECSCC